MAISDRLKLVIAPKLFEVFDRHRVYEASYDFESLNAMNSVQREIRQQVIEIYTPIKLKQFGTTCECCSWASGDVTLMVLHHKKLQAFHSLWAQEYAQREAWNLKVEEEKQFLIQAVVKRHCLEGLSWICRACHIVAHPENRQLRTRTLGSLDAIKNMQAQQGWRPGVLNYAVL